MLILNEPAPARTRRIRWWGVGRLFARRARPRGYARVPGVIPIERYLEARRTACWPGEGRGA